MPKPILRSSILQEVCFKFTVVHCFLCGVDLCCTDNVRTFAYRSQLRVLLTIAIRVGIVSIYTLFLTTKLQYAYANFSDRPATSDIFDIIYLLNSCALFAEAGRALWTNQTFLVDLLRDSQNIRSFNIKRFVHWFMSCCFYTYIDISQAVRREQLTKELESKLLMKHRMVSWCGSYVWQLQYAVFHLYIQGAIIIRANLRGLDVSMDMLSLSKVLEMKMAVRRSVDHFNRTFSRVLVLIYAKIFALAYQGLMIGLRVNELSNVETMIAIIPFLQIVMLYDMAVIGTDVISSCHLLHQKLFLKHKFTSNHHELWRVGTLLMYDERIDALLISDCFPNQKGTLLTYSGTLITCLAIFLQFDYRVMARFDEDKRTFNLTRSW